MLGRYADRVAFLRVAGGDNGNLWLPDWMRRHNRLVIARLWETVLCRRAGLRRVVVPVSAGGRMVPGARVIHDQGATIVTDLIVMRAVTGR